MEKEIKKKITTNDLALMMAKRFDGLDKEVSQISSDLKSFKTETRERFDTLEGKVDGIDENVNAIITDYHPRIKSLEQKVFGFSTLE